MLEITRIMLEICGSCWKSLTDAKKWVVLEICELCWKYVGNAGSLWISLDICWKCWKHMQEMLET